MIGWGVVFSIGYIDCWCDQIGIIYECSFAVQKV